MSLLQITTAPVAEGVMGVCIAGEIDMATIEQVIDAVHTALAAGPPRGARRHGRGDVPGLFGHPDPASGSS